ncbi:hypothetical protein SAMN05421818_102106 [Myroides phaeus]|uniref:Uncharacterized protein n=2 Tax=Myroides phaeus TaxID=702745 RepID=A0A1G8BLR6_9FLAO|nr:hypothetical protein SAMN05421818_102106 [Myroides phaeus]
MFFVRLCILFGKYTYYSKSLSIFVYKFTDVIYFIFCDGNIVIKLEKKARRILKSKLKRMVVVCRFMVPKNYDGITLFPFIFLRSQEMKQDAVLLNHERIHLKQQMELLVVFFYIWYILSFFWNLINKKDVIEAYKSICFEKEAYSFESDFTYLQSRKSFAFLNKNRNNV